MRISDWSSDVCSSDLDDSAGLQMTGAPTVYGRRLFVPISSGIEAFAASDAWKCCQFRGSIVAPDTATAKTLWTPYTTTEEKQVFKTNHLKQPTGGGRTNIM